jgi:RNA polymerase sigma-70 factor (ECF subfamily)
MTAVAKNNLIMGRVALANSETEQDILIQEAKKDRAAFAQLYRMHYELVFRYCSRRLFNRHAAEDVTSTVFLKVMRKMGSFEGNSRGFRNWLYCIATNTINDHLRTRTRRADAIRMAAQELGCSVSAGSDSDLQEINLALKQAVLALQPKYQTVITLRFFEKMRLTEIAEVLDQNPATIRSQLSRALKRLRKELKAVGHLGL